MRTFVDVVLLVAAVANLAAGVVVQPTGPVVIKARSVLDRRQDLPPCVSTCIASAGKAAGCTLSDFNCLCNSVQFIDQSATCFASQCSDAAALWGVQFGQQACLQVGVTESIPPEASSALATKTTAGTSGAFDTTFTPASSASATSAPSSSSAPNQAGNNSSATSLGALSAGALALVGVALSGFLTLL